MNDLRGKAVLVKDTGKVGIGYISALVNLHFAEATPGHALPTEDDVTRAYSTSGPKADFTSFTRADLIHSSTVLIVGFCLRLMLVTTGKS